MKSIALSSLLLTLPLLAQLPAPNAAGVSAGHHIFVVHDLEAANRFWSTLGGEPAQLAQLKLIKFPGVLFLVRQAEANGGTEGSSIDYVGFKVKNLKESLARWEPAGIKPMPGGSATQVFLMGPDNIKVRIAEDRSLAVPIASDELKMVVPNAAEAQAWYAKYFGAKLVKQGSETVGEIPGASLRFAESKTPVAGTKGRALDRLGFEVRNLEEFVKNLQGSGAQMNGQINKAKSMALAVSIITDPWGTYIELSEGLAAVK
jgi:glyoxalase/bleomycin resistance protein/dioxygenase superfamily protein